MPIDKIMDPGIAASAYSNSSKIGSAGKIASGNDTVSFSSFLKDSAREVVNTMRTSEAMSAKAVTEQADLTDVVQAVTAAELTLQTVVAVRDRMLTAYQEIMRMPI